MKPCRPGCRHRRPSLGPSDFILVTPQARTHRGCALAGRAIPLPSRNLASLVGRTWRRHRLPRVENHRARSERRPSGPVHGAIVGAGTGVAGEPCPQGGNRSTSTGADSGIRWRTGVPGGRRIRSAGCRAFVSHGARVHGVLLVGAVRLSVAPVQSIGFGFRSVGRDTRSADGGGKHRSRQPASRWRGCGHRIAS